MLINKCFSSQHLAWYVIVIGLIIIITFTIFGNYIIVKGSLEPNLLAHYGTFIGGTVGVLFSLAGYLLIFSTLKSNKKNQFETTFYNRFTLFQEYRTKQIALKFNDTVYYGLEFFDQLFRKQMHISKGEKKSIDYYRGQFEIHKVQFSYYFCLFEMCISAINEANLNAKQRIVYENFLNNMLGEQEQFIFSIISNIVDEQSFPLSSQFSNRYFEIYNKTILQDF